MRAVIQRVFKATVYADGDIYGFIDKGLYILLGVKDTDTEKDAEALAEKISKLRIFSDENGKMNLSVMDVGGEVLVVSNFASHSLATSSSPTSTTSQPNFFTAFTAPNTNSLGPWSVPIISIAILILLASFRHPKKQQ